MSSSSWNPNLALLARAAEELSPLVDRIVFVGGSVTGLLTSDPAAAPVRPTMDIDAVIEVASYAEFAQLEGEMRQLGFQHDESLICRWSIDNLIVDLMPVDAGILGFSNKWYRPAVEHAMNLDIRGREIRVLPRLTFSLPSWRLFMVGASATSR